MVNYLNFKQLLITAVLLLGSISIFAYDFEVDGIYYNKLLENTVEVTKGSPISNYTETVTVPSAITVDGILYKVTSIGKNAFEGSKGLTSVTLSEGISKLDDYAFNGCKELRSVSLPEGISSIGAYAFYGCI